MLWFCEGCGFIYRSDGRECGSTSSSPPCTIMTRRPATGVPASEMVRWLAGTPSRAPLTPSDTETSLPTLLFFSLPSPKQKRSISYPRDTHRRRVRPRPKSDKLERKRAAAKNAEEAAQSSKQNGLVKVLLREGGCKCGGLAIASGVTGSMKGARTSGCLNIFIGI